MNNITDIYLVDTENVGIEKPDWDFLGNTCIIFYFVTNTQVNFKVDNRVKVVPVITCGKHDALDFMLDSKLGFLMCHYGKKVNYHIVSQDTGFDVMCANWACMGYNINRLDLLGDEPIKTEFDAVIHKLKVDHSRKYKALRNIYKSWLCSKGKDKDVLLRQIKRSLTGILELSEINAITDNYYDKYTKEQGVV